MSFRNTLTAATLCGCIPIAAMAQQTFNEAVIIEDALLCVGNECAMAESNLPSRAGIKLKDTNLGIRFEDTSTGTSLASRDWQISINESGIGGQNLFSVVDLGTNNTPFEIEGGTTTPAIYVRSGGRVGMGTTLPQRDLHILTGIEPTLRLEQNGTAGFSQQVWDIIVSSAGFELRNDVTDRVPFRINSIAPTSSVVVNNDGWVGLGTFSPQAPLELERNESFNFFRITANGAAVNESVDITFTGGPLGTGQLRYNIVDGDNQEMSLDANGNMVLDGTLTTAGPTCAGGCDRVFDADYSLPSIPEHQLAIWQAGHLPAVGPTDPNTPVNITEKMGGILNELEHAHLYIGQLHAELTQLRETDRLRAAEIAALTSRLDALEP